MSKHTPGPWAVDFDGPNRQWLVNSAAFAVATCDGPFKAQEADARLIAAAPDLLMALSWIHELHKNGSINDFDEHLPLALGAARAAILKATGE